jgi:PEP-CTERM motif
MLRRSLMACAGLALLQTQAVADTQYIGTVTMYICDGGEDLCSNTLTSSPITLPTGPFTEDFVFDFVNDSPDTPNDVPLLAVKANIEASNPLDFSPGSVKLYDSSGTAFGFEDVPFVPNDNGYFAQTDSAMYPGTGYYVEVTGTSNAPNLSLQISLNAFDLGGPSGLPEPSTWAMMLLGVVGLGLAARRRTRPTLAIGKKASASN